MLSWVEYEKSFITSEPVFIPKAQNAFFVVFIENNLRKIIVCQNLDAKGSVHLGQSVSFFDIMRSQSVQKSEIWSSSFLEYSLFDLSIFWLLSIQHFETWLRKSCSVEQRFSTFL